jgi:pimeloyl-ACP methyl ester carboxylesterase
MTTSTRPFSRGRIVALVVIAVVALGLGYLHFAGDSGAVAVPSGAQEGQLTLESCTYEGTPADCGTLIVRENRHDPNSRLIALPVKRIRAQAQARRAPVFGLYGGPGHSNFKFTAMTRFADDRDVLLVGYRGVDGSVRLDCPEVVDSRESSSDWLKTSSLESDAAAFRACADRLQDDGVDLAGYTIPQRIDDLELVRRKLGYGPIDLVSESFGTRLALIYAWRYPKSIHRSVMVGVNPPGHFLWYAKTTDEQLQRYSRLCAEDGGCRRRTDDLAATVNSEFDRIPSRWAFMPIKEGNIRAAAIAGLFNATTDGGGPLAGPLTLDTFLSSDEGDASGMWLLSVATQLVFPRVQVAGDVASMGRTDDAYAKRFYAPSAARRTTLGTGFTDFIWVGGRLVDAWPATPDDTLYNTLQDSNVETLLVGGALDFSTPPQVARRELLPHLPNGQQVVLRNLGHTEDFWAYEQAASTRLITTYLDTGRVDTTQYTENRLDLTPSFTQSDVAKIVLGVLLGSAALVLVSVLWLGGRVLRRKTFGQKGSVAVRSLLPFVLGLAGWFTGVLVVLIAFQTVPLTSAALAVVSVAPLVALAVYAGWYRPAAHGTIAILTVLAAAVVCAWLGFHVPDGPALGPLTAIVGAILGANLALITFDVLVAEEAPAGRIEVPQTKTLPGPV